MVNLSALWSQLVSATATSFVSMTTQRWIAIRLMRRDELSD